MQLILCCCVSDVCILLLVFNAAKHSPTMLSMFPSHVMSHYRYLRDSLPDLVPSLEVRLTTGATAPSPSTDTALKSFIEETLSRLKSKNYKLSNYLIVELDAFTMFTFGSFRPVVTASPPRDRPPLQVHHRSAASRVDTETTECERIVPRSETHLPAALVQSTSVHSTQL